MARHHFLEEAVHQLAILRGVGLGNLRPLDLARQVQLRAARGEPIVDALKLGRPDPPAISEAQRMFLLTRDLATLSLLLAVSYLGASLIISIPAFFWLAAGGGVLYLFAATSSRNNGNRFALTVLAEHSAASPAS
ncbi:hypothetical protein [Haloferula sp. A504]|uniref:hypothetical protein n=1 Tax=Haloferula sp. A504 TaxID=3373601 RepID=UPI0031C9F421|nr:hypothetical protein [Verrucomicrobiaceae bacterium E54]